MEREHENTRAALQWATNQGDGETSVRLAGALADFWWIRGYVREGRRWVEHALAVGPEVLPQFRLKALLGAGIIAEALGDHPAARAHLRHALELAETAHDSAATASALSRLGMIAAFGEDAEEAQGLLERSLAVDGVSQGRRASTLFLLGWARRSRGDLEHAEVALTESLELCRAGGNPRLSAAVMGLLARIRLAREDDAGAAALVVAALSSLEAADRSRAVWIAVATAALVSAHRGDLVLAVRLLAAGEAWSETTGDVQIFGPGISEAEEKVTVRAREQMGESAYRAAVADGRALSPDEVVELARTGLEAHPGAGPRGTTASGGPSPDALLSCREQAVLRLIAEGLLNKQIATSLGIGERTVKDVPHIPP